uniref:Uncharacterized protein n=1 Tax=Anguilla anguilla TaxID=7936 RepID=A0A0E9SC61_ANGAN
MIVWPYRPGSIMHEFRKCQYKSFSVVQWPINHHSCYSAIQGIKYLLFPISSVTWVVLFVFFCAMKVTFTPQMLTMV